MTKREEVLQALLALLQGISGPIVARNIEVPTEVPEGGLIILRDDAAGDRVEPETILSPLTYIHTHLAEIEVLAPGRDGAERDAALDALLDAIDGAIASNRTLGGLADWVQLLRPDTSELAIEGAAADKGAVIPVEITYASASSLG